MDIKIHPVKSIQGTIEVPGDKSISHRALIFGSLCEGPVKITNFLPAEDTLSTLNCLKALGVDIEQQGSDVTVRGVGKYGFKAPAEPLDVGNSGTTLRILPGLLAAQNFESTLVGDSSVSKRPMNRIIEPLSKMGARIESKDGHAPLRIIPSPLGERDRVRGQNSLSAIDYQLPVASAQVKSAILLAGLFAEGKTVVTEEHKSRDHTERMLEYLGADITVSKSSQCGGGDDSQDCNCEPKEDLHECLCEDGKHSKNSLPLEGGGLGWGCQIEGASKLINKPIEVPGDLSSAAFFIAAALLLPDSQLTIKNVGLNPTRSGMIDVLEKAGAGISKTNERIANNEPIVDLVVESSKLKPFEINGVKIPLLIDDIPILAVIATQINGTSIISGAEELRVKETDRLAAISTQLKAIGANIEEKEDGLVIKGPSKLKGATVDSGGDHRMAMSLAIAGILVTGETTIQEAECISISFPGFKELLDKVIAD